jgi:hypothetical protein
VPKSLKPGRHLADSGAVYFPLRSESLDLSAERLHGLRLSLNTPVLSIEELPVGPARAAIVIHEEIDGRPSLTVGVRSLRSGVGVLFSLEGDLREHSSLAVGIDAVLSFGESMGFLFDEDELETDFTEEARSRALGLWLELMGVESGASEMSPQVPAAPASPRPASEPDDSFEVEGLYDDEMLLLDEVAHPEDDLPSAFADERGGVDSRPSEWEQEDEKPDSAPVVDALGGAGGASEASGEAPVPLSKFRHCAPSQPPSPSVEEVQRGVGESPPAAKGAALGRLKLVKRRKGGGDHPPKPSVIRRLLSSF